jgi:hypothetical protein
MSSMLFDARNFSQHHGQIFLTSEDTPYGRGDLPGRQHSRRHLMKKRLKQVVIRSIKEDDADWRVPKSLGGS